MPAKDLGSKHTCFKCETKFYDLKKAAVICPKCGADQRDSPALKAPPASERKSRAAKPVEPVVVDEAEAVEEAEDVEAEEEAEDSVEDEDG
jgi:uncharacterized protein (TIGR02300 family)